MKQLKYPDGFLWGGALWSVGCEGARDEDGKSPDVWDAWYKEEPKRFYEQTGPGQTIDFYHRYREYIQMFKKLHMNSFRFSISWARFMPQGNGEVNEKAVTFYNQVIDELLANDIEPILCLWHFDLPQCMQDIGGFASRQVVDYFYAYAKEVLARFGHKVNYVMVLNEVGVHPQGGYLYDFHPPHIIDFKMSIQVGYHLLLAQAKVIQHYHKMKYPGEIGTVLNPNPVYAKSDAVEDTQAAKFVDMIRERFYLDVSVKGALPEDFLAFCKTYDVMPETQDEDEAILKEGIVDLLGVNYYQPCRVQAPQEHWHPQFYPENDKQDTRAKVADPNQLMPEKFYSIYDWPGKVINKSRGWEIYPEGIYDTLMRLKNDYGNIKCFIGENGIGIEGEDKFYNDEQQVEDDYRISFHEQHLYWIHKAIQEGSNCIGYHVWAPLDNWSPVNAFKNRYGFYRYYQKTKSWKIKKSGEWLRKVYKGNILEIDFM